MARHSGCWSARTWAPCTCTPTGCWALWTTVTRFFATVPAGGRLDTIRLVRTAANGHLALAAYLPDQSARCHGYGIMVFTITGEGIATITGFPSPRLFERFGLPPTCA